MRLQARQDGAFQSDQKKTVEGRRRRRRRGKKKVKLRFTCRIVWRHADLFLDSFLTLILSKRRRGLLSWSNQTDLSRQQVWDGKDERPININLPLRPPFQALKYLIVFGQLCCFVGRASVDPFYKTTPVPAQWRPCLVAPHCPRNGRLQRIQDFFFFPPFFPPLQAAPGWQESVHCVLLEKGINPEFRLETWAHRDGFIYLKGAKLHGHKSPLSQTNPSTCFTCVLKKTKRKRHKCELQTELREVSSRRGEKGDIWTVDVRMESKERRNQFCSDVATDNRNWNDTSWEPLPCCI